MDNKGKENEFEEESGCIQSKNGDQVSAMHSPPSERITESQVV